MGAIRMKGTAVVVAIAVLAYGAANVAHEGSHGLACVAVGGDPVALSAIYFDCDEAAVAPSLVVWIPAAGTLANLVLFGVAWVVLRRSGPGASAARYFWWLFMTINALQAGGYWLFSGIGDVGDWAKVIAGWSPHGLWRAALAVAGLAVYLAAIRLSLRELAPFLGDGADRVRRARSLVLAPYLAGGALYVAAGLLNPIGLFLVLLSAFAASFGGTSALAWMWTLVDSRRFAPRVAGPAWQPQGSPVWTVAALLFAAGFIAVLGPAIQL